MSKPSDDGIWIPSLRPNQEDYQQILQSLAELYVKGVKIDWLGFDKDYSRSKVVLPTYPFQRQSYWIENSLEYSRKTTTSSDEHKTTNIVELLNNGNTQKLVQLLLLIFKNIDGVMILIFYLLLVQEAINT